MQADDDRQRRDAAGIGAGISGKPIQFVDIDAVIDVKHATFLKSRMRQYFFHCMMGDHVLRIHIVSHLRQASPRAGEHQVDARALLCLRKVKMTQSNLNVLRHPCIA